MPHMADAWLSALYLVASWRGANMHVCTSYRMYTGNHGPTDLSSLQSGHLGSSLLVAPSPPSRSCTAITVWKELHRSAEKKNRNKETIVSELLSHCNQRYLRIYIGIPVTHGILCSTSQIYCQAWTAYLLTLQDLLLFADSDGAPDELDAAVDTY